MCFVRAIRGRARLSYTEGGNVKAKSGRRASRASTSLLLRRAHLHLGVRGARARSARSRAALWAAFVAAAAPAGARRRGLGRRALGRRGRRRLDRGRHVPAASPAAATGRRGAEGSGLGLRDTSVRAAGGARPARKLSSARASPPTRAGPAAPRRSPRRPLPRGLGSTGVYLTAGIASTGGWAGPAGSRRSGKAGCL